MASDPPLVVVVEIPKGGHTLEDLPELLRKEIEQFFSIYKDIEEKEVVVDGWRSREEAIEEIEAARHRFSEASG